MRRNKSKDRLYILLILLLAVTVGYAALSTTLKINGSANISKNTWDIYWANPVVSSGSITNTPPTIVDDTSSFKKAKIIWDVSFDLPGDFYEFTVDAVNNGSLDAMILNISDEVSSTLPEYIKYEVTYVDGSKPEKKDVLTKKKGDNPTTLKYKVRVYYDPDYASATTINQMTSSVTYNFSLEIAYGQADETAYYGYSLGKSVKYDPVSNSTCTSGSTCYDWNSLNLYDYKNNNIVTLQLDHNLTTNDVIWISKADYNNNSQYGTHGKTDKGPITALKTLESLTSSWNDALKLNYTYDTTGAVNNYGVLTCVNGACDINGNSVTSNLKARIITGEELAKVTVAAGACKNTIAYNWTQASSNIDEWYFFSRSNKVIGTVDDMPTGEKSSIELKWLVSNTTANSISGATANAYGGSTGGYWTLTPVSNDATQAWSVGGSQYEPYNGNVGAYYAGNDSTYGLRPVITIPKSVLDN